ncbi:MAG: OsmC family protein [Omnitrophica WOR_2 bacterium]
MKISARLTNSLDNHQVTLTTDGRSQSLQISPKPAGLGSSVNGGELLFLALATCYCNDLYREADRQGIRVVSVEVDVNGDFAGIGEPARNVSYHARVTAQASQEAIQALMAHTDQVAEIQNTLRVVTPVVLEKIEAIAV